MPTIRLDSERRLFQERLLTQFRARYRGWDFSARDDDFGVLAHKDRAQVALSLESLFAEASRPEVSMPERISHFVSAAAPRLSAAEDRPELSTPTPDPGALVWCVRAGRSIRRFSRYAELATRELPGGLLAFVAEALPGDAMRGVSRAEAEMGGLAEENLVELADRNTALRLTRWSTVLKKEPEQRTWLFTDDILFASSLLLVPAFLERLAELGDGRAALAAPDRAMVVAGIGDAASHDKMTEVVRRLYRLASFPLSPILLSTDGQSLQLHPAQLKGEVHRTGWWRLFGQAER